MAVPPPTTAFGVGSRVDGLYDGNQDDMWYPGRIQRVNEDEPVTYQVLYDDGEVEPRVALHFLRNHIAGTLSIGTRVFGRYAGGDEWYPGKVSEVQENGCYTVEYDDTEVETDVPLEYIREPDEATLKNTESTGEQLMLDAAQSETSLSRHDLRHEDDDDEAATAGDLEEDAKDGAGIGDHDSAEPFDSKSQPAHSDTLSSSESLRNAHEHPRLHDEEIDQEPREQSSSPASTPPMQSGSNLERPRFQPKPKAADNEQSNGVSQTDEYASILESLELLERRLADAASIKAVLSTLVKQMRAFPQVTADLVHEHNGEKLVINVLKFHDSHAVIQCYCFVLLRRLCFLCAKSTHYFLRNGIVDFVTAAMRKFAEDAILQASACGALAVFTRVHAGLNILLQHRTAELVLATIVYHKTYSVHTRQVHYYACEVLLELCELGDQATLDVLCSDQIAEGLGDISPVSLLIFLLRQGLSFDDKKASCAVGTLLMCLAANNRYAAGLILRLNGLPELSTVMAKFPTEPGIQKYSTSASKEIALSSVQKAPTKKVKEMASEILQESGSLEELHHERFRQENGNNGSGMRGAGESRSRHQPVSTSGRTRTPGTSSKRKTPLPSSFGYPSPTRGAASGPLSYKDPQSFSKFASPIGKAPYLPSNMTTFAAHSSASSSMGTTTQRNSLVILESGGPDLYPSERKQFVKEERQSLLFETYGVQGAIARENNTMAHGIKRKQLKTHIVSAAEKTWATPVVSPKKLLRDEMLAGPSSYAQPYSVRADTMGGGSYGSVRSRGYELTTSEDDRMRHGSSEYYYPSQQPYRSELSPSNRKRQEATTTAKTKKRATPFQVSVESSTQLRVSREMHSPVMVPGSPTHKRSKHSMKGAIGGVTRHSTAKGMMSGQRATAGPMQRSNRFDSNTAADESLTAYAAKLFNDEFGFDSGDLNGGGADLHRTSINPLTAREQAEIQERERLSFAEKLHKMIDKAKSTLAVSNVSSEPVGSRSSRSTTSDARSARSKVPSSSSHLSPPTRVMDTPSSSMTATTTDLPLHVAAAKKSRLQSSGMPKQKTPIDDNNKSSPPRESVAASSLSKAASSQDPRRQIGSKAVVLPATKRPLASLPAATMPAVKVSVASSVSSAPRPSKQPPKPASKPKPVSSVSTKSSVIESHSVPYATPVEKNSSVSNIKTKIEVTEEVAAAESMEAAVEVSNSERAAMIVSVETPAITQESSPAPVSAVAISEPEPAYHPADPEPQEKSEDLPATIEDAFAVSNIEEQLPPVASNPLQIPLENAPDQVETTSALEDARAVEIDHDTNVDRIATPDSSEMLVDDEIEARVATVDPPATDSAVEPIAASDSPHQSPSVIEKADSTDTKDAADPATARSSSELGHGEEQQEVPESAAVGDQANLNDGALSGDQVEDTPPPETTPSDDMYADEYNDFDEDGAEDEASPENLDDPIIDHEERGVPLDELLALAEQAGASVTEPSSGVEANESADIVAATVADEQTSAQAEEISLNTSKAGDELYADDDVSEFVSEPNSSRSVAAPSGEDGALMEESVPVTTDAKESDEATQLIHAAAVEAASPETSSEHVEQAVVDERAVESTEIPSEGLETESDSSQVLQPTEDAETHAADADVPNLEKAVVSLPSADEELGVDASTPSAPSEESTIAGAVDAGGEVTSEPAPIAETTDEPSTESISTPDEATSPAEKSVPLDNVNTEPESIVDRPESRGADSYADDGFDFDPEEEAKADTSGEVTSPTPADESALTTSSLAAETGLRSEQNGAESARVEPSSDASTADEVGADDLEALKVETELEPASGEAELQHQDSGTALIDGDSEAGATTERGKDDEEDGTSSNVQPEESAHSRFEVDKSDIAVAEFGEMSEAKDSSEAAALPSPTTVEASGAAPALDTTIESKGLVDVDAVQSVGAVPPTEEAAGDKAPVTDAETKEDTETPSPDDANSAAKKDGGANEYGDDDYEASFEAPEVASAQAIVDAADESRVADASDLASREDNDTSEDVAKLSVHVSEDVVNGECAVAVEVSEERRDQDNGSEVTAEQVDEAGVKPSNDTEIPQVSNSTEAAIDQGIEAPVSTSSSDATSVPDEHGDSPVRESEIIEHHEQDEPPNNHFTASDPSSVPEDAGDEIEGGVQSDADILDDRKPDEAFPSVDVVEPESGSLDTVGISEAGTASDVAADHTHDPAAMDPPSFLAMDSGADADPTEAADEPIPVPVVDEDLHAVASAGDEVAKAEAELSVDNYDNEFENDEEVDQVNDKVEDATSSEKLVAKESTDDLIGSNSVELKTSEPVNTDVQVAAQPNDQYDPIVNKSASESAVVDTPAEVVVEATLLDDVPVAEISKASDEPGEAAEDIKRVESSPHSNEGEAVNEPDSLVAVASSETFEAPEPTAGVDTSAIELATDEKGSAGISNPEVGNNNVETLALDSSNGKLEDEPLYEDEYSEDANQADPARSNNATVSDASPSLESISAQAVAPENESAEIADTTEAGEREVIVSAAAEIAKEESEIPADVLAKTSEVLASNGVQEEGKTAPLESSESVHELDDAAAAESSAHDTLPTEEENEESPSVIVTPDENDEPHNVDAAADEEDNGYDDDGDFEETASAPPDNEAVTENPVLDSVMAEPVDTQDAEPKSLFGEADASVAKIEPAPSSLQELADAVDDAMDAIPAFSAEAAGGADQTQDNDPEVTTSIAEAVEGADTVHIEEPHRGDSAAPSPEVSIPGNENSLSAATVAASDDKQSTSEDLPVHETSDEPTAEYAKALEDSSADAVSQSEEATSISEADATVLEAEASEPIQLLETEPGATVTQEEEGELEKEVVDIDATASDAEDAPAAVTREYEGELNKDITDVDAAPNDDGAAEKTEGVLVDESPLETESTSDGHQLSSELDVAYDEFDKPDEAPEPQTPLLPVSPPPPEAEIVQEIQSDEVKEGDGAHGEIGVEPSEIEHKVAPTVSTSIANVADIADPTKSIDASADYADQAETKDGEVESPEELAPSAPSDSNQPMQTDVPNSSADAEIDAMNITVEPSEEPAASARAEDEPAQTDSSNLATGDVAVAEPDPNAVVDSVQQESPEVAPVTTDEPPAQAVDDDDYADEEDEGVPLLAAEVGSPFEPEHGAPDTAPPPSQASPVIADDDYADDLEDEVASSVAAAAAEPESPAEPELVSHDTAPTLSDTTKDSAVADDDYADEEDESASLILPSATISGIEPAASASAAPQSPAEPPASDDDYADKEDDYNDFEDEQEEVVQPPLASSSAPSAVASTDSTPREVEDDDATPESASASTLPVASSKPVLPPADVDDEDEYAIEDEFEDDDKPAIPPTVAAPPSSTHDDNTAASTTTATPPQDEDGAENEYEADYDDAAYDDFDE